MSEQMMNLLAARVINLNSIDVQGLYGLPNDAEYINAPDDPDIGTLIEITVYKANLVNNKYIVTQVIIDEFTNVYSRRFDTSSVTPEWTTWMKNAATGDGSGSVTNVSVTSANGFGGTVANPSTTPAITITTNVNGLMKGNGTSVSAATQEDVLTLLGTLPIDNGGTGATTAQGARTAILPTQTGNTGKILGTDGTDVAWVDGDGSGTVTDVSVNDVNGFGGTVDNSTTTPAINITTSVEGFMFGSDGAASAATRENLTNLLSTVELSEGGTGATTANEALNNLLPDQTGNAGKILGTDGENAAWVVDAGGMTNPMTEAGDLIIGGTPDGGVAPATRLAKGSPNQVLTMDFPTGLPYWGENLGAKQYQKEKYVDGFTGNDTTGDGSYAKPWKTLTHTLGNVPNNSTIFIMYPTSDTQILINSTLGFGSIHISSCNNRNIALPQVIIDDSDSTADITFSNLTLAGVAIQPTNAANVYLNNCILTNNINKRGTGYLECNFVDANTHSTSIRSGTFSAFGGKFVDLTVNLTGDTPPIATFNNCKLVGAINVQDGAKLTLINNLITGTTEDPVLFSDTGFGTVVNMIGNELYTASGAPAAVSVDTYTLYNQIFDKENSTFGTSSSDTSWSDKLGITTTETITTATTMLVRNSDGSIAEQLIPSGGAYQYSKIRYVDPVNGSDITGNGAYGNPWKTVAHAVTTVSSGMIICLMGTTTEVAFSISKTNIDIIAIGTRSGLNGFTNLVTITGTGAGSIRFQDLNFAGGLTRQTVSTCGLYVYNGSIGSNGGFNQNGNGYTEFVGVDASNSLHGIGSGTFNVFGGKITFPTITGSTASVTFDNVDYIAGNGTSTTAAMINILESNWIAGATGFALEVTDINAVTTIQGCNIIRPDGATLAPVSLTLFDIQDTDFNRDESSLGMHVGNTDWFSKLGLVVEPNAVTTSDYYLTLVAGVLSRQKQAAQVSLPAVSMYSSTSSVQNVDFKTSGGVSVYTHPSQLCSTTGNVVFNEFFNLNVPVSSQFRAKGSFMLYNVSAITSATYEVSVSLLALSESGGILTILGSPAVFTLNKAAYAYNPISFDALVPSSPSTYTQLGIRITITGAESGKTALINSLFAEYILS